MNKRNLQHPETRLRLPSKELEQGEIFNAYNFKNFEAYQCSAIIITRRCALAREKHAVVHCLPIIPFKAWKNEFLFPELIKKEKNKIEEAIQQYLRKSGFGQAVIDTYKTEAFLERLQPHQRDEIQNLLTNLNQLAQPRWSEEEKKCFLTRTASKSFINDKITALIQQKLADYYFLNTVDPYESTTQGYVVLFQQIFSVPLNDMNKIVHGVDQRTILQEQDLLTFHHVPNCIFTGVLRSPDIEHLVQKFAQIFTAVGIEDQKSMTIKIHLQSIQEEQ